MWRSCRGGSAAASAAARAVGRGALRQQRRVDAAGRCMRRLQLPGPPAGAAAGVNAISKPTDPPIRRRPQSYINDRGFCHCSLTFSAYILASGCAVLPPATAAPSGLRTTASQGVYALCGGLSAGLQTTPAALFRWCGNLSTAWMAVVWRPVMLTWHRALLSFMWVAGDGRSTTPYNCWSRYRSIFVLGASI